MAENTIAKYMTDTGEIELSPQIIKAYLVSGDPDKVTSQEVMMFLQLCKYQKLNPFLREAYLIKFGNTPASLIVGKEVFTKRAAKIESSNGWQAGVIVANGKNELVYREGSLIVDGEKLVGGWCKVYRKDWAEPVLNTVSLKEYVRYNKEGKVMHNWQQMPGTMIMKVAIVQGLRNVFPEEFQEMYSPEEMPVDDNRLSNEPVNVTPTDFQPKPPIQPTTTMSDKAEGKPRPNDQIKHLLELIAKSGAGKEVTALILQHDTRDPKKLSQAEITHLTELFEGDQWQSRFRELQELDVVAANQ